MKKVPIFITAAAIACGCFLFCCGGLSAGPHGKKPQADSRKTQLMDGDIVFQESQSAQCAAVQLATHSRYAHCGIIFIDGGKQMVYEAVEPVRITALSDWIMRGKDRHYVVKRLKNADSLLTPERLKSMKTIAKSFQGLHYDLYFGWSDDRIYCSELVWKIYQRAAGIEIGSLQRMKELDFSHPSVQRVVKERYGDNIPLEESVITPARLFESNLLETVPQE